MKIGVYFCRCGSNIADKVSEDRLREITAQFPGQPHFFAGDFLCSESGTAAMADDLRTNGIERAVVCACSPRDHEPTFMRVMRTAGLNPYLLQMVNIREQVAWVTQDPGAATEKAGRYLTAAVQRLCLHEPLEKREVEICPDLLVIGAGPAGLKAALAAADAGRKVVLVEKSPAIGGLPVMYEDLFPAMECGPCLLEPVMGEVLHGTGDIELLTMAEVTNVVGSFGNFTVQITQKPRCVDTHACVGCAECIAPCPVSVPNEFNNGLDTRKAIAFPFAGALPNAPFVDPACRRLLGGDCHACVDACPVENAIRFEETERTMERRVGAVVLATGSGLFDSRKIPALGYGTTPDVYSSLEFERLLASNGPTGGEIATSQGRAPKTVAIVHCVGSLDEQYREYCSGVCCQYAFKFNHIVRKKHPEARVLHFYREIVAPGKDGAGLFREIQHDAQTTLVRYERINALRIEKADDGVLVRCNDAAYPADMVVLCPAIEPAGASRSVGELFEVGTDQWGFFRELHGRADTAQSQVKGVLLAGTCQAPTSIPGAMTQAMAAAGYALASLVPGRKLDVGPVTAAVVAERCSGCRTCGRICPYKAITFDDEQGISSVNEVLCHGCGTCVAGCPAGAIVGRHFTSQQILAELEGVLHP